MATENFSVWQFLDNAAVGCPPIRERVRHLVPMDEALSAFMHYIDNVAAKTLKITQRVIMTDGEDFICMEWKRGEGITFPPELLGTPLAKVVGEILTKEGYKHD